MNATEETIFNKALDKRDRAERSAYLDQACAGDAALRKHIEQLVSAYSEGAFLEAPAAGLAATVHQEPAEKTGTLIGPYKLLELIGEGGMGLVYMAEQQRPVRRLVAVKLIKPGMDSKQVIARFDAERQALAMMDHPSIAKVLEAGTAQTGRPYFVMELVRGMPLNEFCDHKHLSVRQRLQLVIQVCQAVQHAHQKGIIHRDLKPTNVLVTMDDVTPLPKIIDFGIAKALGQALTDHSLHTGFTQLIGTPLYMSPEQADINYLGVDTRSDVYSLGVMLYELLTGATPFDKETLTKAGFDEMRRIIREQDPPKPSARVSTLNAQVLSTVSTRRNTDPRRISIILRGELDWIVMKALEKDRSRRYESASALAADIERYLADEPVQACPPSATYRFSKFARRNRVLLTATAAVVSALVLGTAISSWQAVRATWAEKAATANLARAVAEEQRAIKAAKSEAAQRLVAESSQRQAQASETAAKQSAAEARSVLSFFQDTVLAAGRPEGKQGGLGKDATIRQAIDAAAASIGDSFKDQPLVEASIRYALGTNYHLMGEPKLAIAQMERSWELRKADLGEGHPDALVSLSYLGSSCRRAGLLDRSRAIAVQAYEIAKQHLPLEHRERIRTIGNLASAYYSDGKVDLALPLWEQEYELVKAKHGDDHDWALSAAHNLGLVYSKTGQLDRALEFAQQTVDRSVQRLGPTHYDTLQSMSGLAWIHLKRNQPDLAIKLFRTVLGEREKSLPPGHYFTLNSMTDLAGAYRAAKDDANAELLYRQSLELHEKHLGLEHSQTRTTITNLVLLLLEQKKYNEAESLLRKALSDSTRELPDPWKADAHHKLGFALDAQGRVEEAIVEYREGIRLRPDYFGSHYKLGVALQAQGQVAEAIAEYREAVRLDPDFVDAHNKLGCLLCDVVYDYSGAEAAFRDFVRLRQDSAIARTNLGNALLGQEKWGEAIAEYREALRIQADYASAHNGLAWTLATAEDPHWHQLEEALTHAKKAAELAPNKPNNWNALGVVHYRRGEWQAAVLALKKPEELAPSGKFDNWIFLAMAHWQLGQPDEARQWYDKAVEWMKTNASDAEAKRFRAEADALLGVSPRP